MGLYKTSPPLSGRMGALWCLASIADSAVIEYGCMGHMAYGRTFLHRMGAYSGKLYSTHIGETDIAMGDTSRLTAAIEQVSETENVQTIFLLPSSVPEIIGIDLEAIANELAPIFPDIRLIPLSCGGFDECGHKGVELTLLHLAKVLTQNVNRTEKPTFNIIGSCADLFNFVPDSAEIERLASNAFSAKRLCTMTSDTSISELEKLGSAHFNLVIRHEGEATAKYLYQQYGTPYLMGRPYGVEGTINWLYEIKNKFGLCINKEFVEAEQKRSLEQTQAIRVVMGRFLRVHKEESKLILAGHVDTISGIAAFTKGSFGFEQVFCFSDCSCMASQDIKSLDDETKVHLAASKKGFLMGSGELLNMANRDRSMQIAVPENLWHHAYEPPLVGFRGSVNLATILVNDMMCKD